MRYRERTTEIFKKTLSVYNLETKNTNLQTDKRNFSLLTNVKLHLF